eukprot:CAMPEP_0206575470 /NCGR_PEP_ID=MMETSP0325_2-20121206/30095_1 /ASSEMBLY_ACC=CAM_ASM_000347 /TAXON_ID=2866 /ORGANISM="Crypthecodinium cohnii, Strain Seligo" /LENGTH=67 /DNA_ID=CAMNT_0054080341 /DNA_START=85 /DNA_END=288 /DNA_ORIENTATION=+
MSSNPSSKSMTTPSDSSCLLFECRASLRACKKACVRSNMLLMLWKSVFNRSASTLCKYPFNLFRNKV